MGPQEKRAIVEVVAIAISGEDVDGDTITMTQITEDGDLRVETERGNDFLIKIEED